MIAELTVNGKKVEVLFNFNPLPDSGNFGICHYCRQSLSSLSSRYESIFLPDHPMGMHLQKVDGAAYNDHNPEHQELQQTVYPAYVELVKRASWPVHRRYPCRSKWLKAVNRLKGIRVRFLRKAQPLDKAKNTWLVRTGHIIFIGENKPERTIARINLKTGKAEWLNGNPWNTRKKLKEIEEKD